MEGYLTTNEAAEKLGVSGQRIRKMIADGLIKADKFGKSHLIPEAEVERLAKIERKAGRPKEK